jgi:tRNA pseudouridine38-40 synthase
LSGRIALGLEYDGAPFAGWQTQPGGRGVQDALEQALAGIAGHPVRVTAAGRTDAGVHATLQVVHFDTSAARPDSAWVRGVNASLPAAVSVRWAVRVATDFHARFEARARSYAYLLLDAPVRPAILSGKIGWFHRRLALPPMREAARCLLGTHDFSAFRAAQCQARTPVRTLRSLEVRRAGEMVAFEFTADAFLHHMVRNIVGCLVYVGQGRQPPEWVAGVLAGGDRAAAAPTFSPHGLYLTGVDYGPEAALPEAHRPPPFG